MTEKRLRPLYRTELIEEDIAERGWMATDLARATRLSNATISDFQRGRRQTAKTAMLIARALGVPIRRYLIRGTDTITRGKL